MKIQSKGVELKPYSLKELALMYGVSNPTMKNWIHRHKEKIGERIGHYYLISQVKTIFHVLGSPGTSDDDTH
ncbi:MAG: hypothetical protein JNM88_14050 [Chitinophagaceae bacterium]|nr:hypothetical protein [Chitinophagaceae bacterium]